MAAAQQLLAGRLRGRQSLRRWAQLQHERAAQRNKVCTVVKSRLLMISVSRPANGDGQVQQAGHGEDGQKNEESSAPMGTHLIPTQHQALQFRSRDRSLPSCRASQPSSHALTQHNGRIEGVCTADLSRPRRLLNGGTVLELRRRHNRGRRAPALLLHRREVAPAVGRRAGDVRACTLVCRWREG